MTTSRLETFSDGVFAIAATLLVLDLRVPPLGSGALWPQLLAQWPSYFGYLVSFLTIGIIWVNHHALFALLKWVDRPILFLNLLLLLVVSVIPFPTALLGEWIVDPQQGSVAAAILGCVYLLMGLAFGGIWSYAVLHHDLAGPSFNRSGARASIPRFTIGNLGYLLGIGLAFVSPVISLAVYLLVAVYYVFPSLPQPQTEEEG